MTSTERLDVEPFNARLAAARASGEMWPETPVEVVVRLLEPVGGAHVSIRADEAGGELPDRVVVTVTQDGFRDDSVAGIWHRVALVRVDGPAGPWQVASIERAFRCARVRNLDRYTRDLCP